MAIGRFQKKSNENVVKKHRQTGHGSRSCRKPLTVVRRPPKGGPVLRTFEKYSGVDGNSVLRILIRKAKCCRGRK